MKTIFIGDIHGRDVWKTIIDNETPNRVVFMGDYFDSFDISPAEQQYNFKEIIEFKEKGECEVIMLVGNHDFHYFLLNQLRICIRTVWFVVNKSITSICETASGHRPSKCITSFITFLEIIYTRT